MRLEMKSTQDGGRNEMKFCFEDGPKKRPIQQKPVILVLIK